MIKIENYALNDKLKETQELLNEILNAEPYCDFWSAKCRVIKHLQSNDTWTEKEIFLLEALSCMLDYVAFKHDTENLRIPSLIDVDQDWSILEENGYSKGIPEKIEIQAPENIPEIKFKKD